MTHVHLPGVLPGGCEPFGGDGAGGQLRCTCQLGWARPRAGASSSPGQPSRAPAFSSCPRPSGPRRGMAGPPLSPSLWAPVLGRGPGWALSLIDTLTPVEWLKLGMCWSEGTRGSLLRRHPFRTAQDTGAREEAELSKLWGHSQGWRGEDLAPDVGKGAVCGRERPRQGPTAPAPGLAFGLQY